MYFRPPDVGWPTGGPGHLGVLGRSPPSSVGRFPSFVGNGYVAAYWIGASYTTGGQALLVPIRAVSRASTTPTIPSASDARGRHDGRHDPQALHQRDARRVHPTRGRRRRARTPCASAATRTGTSSPRAALDEVRILTVARTANQIRARWRSAQLPAPGLLAVYHLTEAAPTRRETRARRASERPPSGRRTRARARSSSPSS